MKQFSVLPMLLLLGAAQPPAVASASLKVARYNWHRCVTLAAFDETESGIRPGGLSMAVDACQGEEGATQKALNATLGLEGDYGKATKLMDDWRTYEIHWAKKIIEAAQTMPRPPDGSEALAK